MGKSNLINGTGATAWLRLAIYIAITLVTVSVMFGRSDQKIEANTEQISRCTEKYEKCLDSLQSIDRRLARIEGRLEIDGGRLF